MPEPTTPNPYPPADRGVRPYSGSGYAGVGFRGVGGDLLKTFPPLAPPDPTPPAIDPTAPGFGSHGAYLLAPIRTGPGDARTSPCPVCHTPAALPLTAGGWTPLRCDACGTEFVASDGSTPPPPPPPPPPPEMVTVTVRLPVRVPRPSALSAPILSSGDVRMARCPACHSLESVPRGATGPVAVRCLSCGADFTATDTPAPPPVPPPPPPTKTTFVYESGGAWYAPCPGCAKRATVPTGVSGEVRLTCLGCGSRFAARIPYPADPWSRPDAGTAWKDFWSCWAAVGIMLGLPWVVLLLAGAYKWLMGLF